MDLQAKIQISSLANYAALCNAGDSGLNEANNTKFI
jgi:hypothetical protein